MIKNSSITVSVQQVGRFLRKHMLIVACVVVATTAVVVFMLRTALPLSLVSSQAAGHRIDQPLSLNLGQKVASVDTSRIRIAPQVEGSWRLVRGALLASDKLVFTPKTDFVVATTYRVSQVQVSRVGFGTALLDTRFQTETAPGLEKHGLTELAPEATVAADAQVEVSLTAPNNNLRHLELRSVPAIDFEPSIVRDTHYRWKPKGVLPQSTKVTFEIYDTKNKESLLKKTVTIAAEPVVTSPVERTRLQADSQIALTFAEPIIPAGDAHIQFTVPGKGVWKSATEYMYTPDKLEPGHTYSYTITPGLRTQKGGILQKPQTGKVSTIGAVYVTSSSPRGEGLAQQAQTVAFTFDQPVDHASAEKLFSVSAGTVTGFSWSGNTLRAAVANLGYQQTVTATVGAGVANTGFGLPSTRAFTVSFTTEIRSVRLNVPFYRQQHSGTCSAAALRMALQYRGIGSDEMSLVNAMGYAPRSIDKSTDPPTWDDSTQMFVGSVDGSIAAGTGAGPDAPPIAKAARAYGRSAEAVTGISVSWIAQQVYSGNPVLLFGAFRANSGMTSWQTPEGKTIVMNMTGHVTTVIGVKGEAANPLGFWVNDPLSGGTQYWSAAAVAANSARDPARQAVVVY